MPNPLLVTLDDPDGLAAALRSDVAPLVFDLGDAEDPGDRLARRGAALSALDQHRRGRTETRSTATPDASPLPEGEGKRAGLPRDWRRGIVRVASLASGLVDGDLDAVMAGLPDAVLLSAVAGARDLQHLAAKLAVREAEHGLPAGHTGIIALPADTAAGVLALASVPGATLRLRALAWDPAALAAGLGVDADAAPVRAARDLLLIAAAAAGVPALDFGLAAADLAAACSGARRDGFAGRFARSLAEIDVIAEAFSRPPARAATGLGRPYVD